MRQTSIDLCEWDWKIFRNLWWIASDKSCFDQTCSFHFKFSESKTSNVQWVLGWFSHITQMPHGKVRGDCCAKMKASGTKESFVFYNHNNQVIIWHSIILIRHFCKRCRNQFNLITNCEIPFVLIMHCVKSKTNFLPCFACTSLSLRLSFPGVLNFLYLLTYVHSFGTVNSLNDVPLCARIHSGIIYR